MKKKKVAVIGHGRGGPTVFGIPGGIRTLGGQTLFIETHYKPSLIQGFLKIFS